jgi:hypothetical protein
MGCRNLYYFQSCNLLSNFQRYCVTAFHNAVKPEKTTSWDRQPVPKRNDPDSLPVDSNRVKARDLPMYLTVDQLVFGVPSMNFKVIPLAQMSAERVTSLYDLMDAAYDAPQIHEYSAKLGHVPIIDNNPRCGEKKHMDPATKARFAERSAAERVNSDLKDNHGGSHVRVKGASKVMTHLMFGLLAIAAKQIIRLII